MRVICSVFLAILGALTLTVSVARGQQQSQQAQQPADQATPPIPAIHSPLASSADNGQDSMADPQRLAPDTRALAGVQELSLGGPAVVHSYWQPHFDFTSTLDSNGLSSTQNSGWTTWSSLMAGVDMRRVSGNSDLTLSYLGGGTISNNGSLVNSIVQELDLKEAYAFRRETLTVLDQLDYIPEAAFGYSAFGTLQLPPGAGLQPGFNPSQSILTPQGQRIGNTFATEVDVNATPRSSLSFTGSYGLLHFFDNDLLNYNSFSFQGGYNYQMTRNDTVAVFYRFNGFRYSEFNQSINAHSIQVSFARRVTGQLAFQIAGGPEVALSRLPITGNSNTTGTGETTQVYWTLSGAVQYQLRRTGLGLSYSHGLTGGSGVLSGSVSDVVTGSASRQISRTIAGNFNAGYSRNTGVPFPNGVAVLPANQTYDYWFAGAGISHPLGRSMNLSVSYQLQYQNSSAPFCIALTCQTSFTRNLISFSMGWRKQPIPF
jgi:hypothetical protein